MESSVQEQAHNQNQLSLVARNGHPTSYTPSANKALKPTHFRGTYFVQNRTKYAPLQRSV